MWHNNLHQAARRRSHFTGEGLRRALNALRRQDPAATPIPAASPAQAHLEVEFLNQIGRASVTDDSGWRPGDDPFGLKWVTPHPDCLDIGIRMRHLPSLLRAILPIYHDDHPEPLGICGLRFRVHGTSIDLFRLGLPGRVRIRGLTPMQWWTGVNTMLAEMVRDEAPGLESALWHHYPDRLHPVEADFAHAHEAGYSSNSASPATHLSAVASDFLRHHMIFRRPDVGSVDLWTNVCVQLEWFGGPTHQEIVADLTDPVFGMNARLASMPCPDCNSGRCIYSVSLASGTGELISLRRNGSQRYGLVREERAPAQRQKRLEMLRNFAGSTALIDPSASLQSPAPQREQQQPRTQTQPGTEPLSTQPGLGERARNSIRVMEDSAVAPIIVRFAAAWNAFTVIGLISAALASCASLGSRNFDTASTYARRVSAELHHAVGDELIHSRGRTADTTTTTEAEFNTAWDHVEIELLTLDDDGIDRIAAAVVSLATALRTHVAAIITDDDAHPVHQKLASLLDRHAELIWAHYGGDDAGWWA